MTAARTITRLQAARDKSGLTQEAVAEQLIRLAREANLGDGLGVNSSMVSTWERGKKKPRKAYRKLLCELYRATEEQLGFLPPSAEPYSAEVQIPIGRREIMEFFRLLSLADSAMMLGSVSAAVDSDRIAFLRTHPTLLDDATLDEFSKLNDLLWADFCAASQKRTVFDRVTAQTQTLIECLREVHTAPHHKRLLALLGDILQLAGELFFDLNQYFEAARTYTVAIAACKEARAFDLLACALTRQAFVWIYKRRYDDAVEVLHAAWQAANLGDGSLATRYWVSTTTAHAYAGRGDAYACNSALDVADGVLSLSGRMGTGGWLRFDGSRLAEERGSCFVSLGLYKKAEPELTRAFAQKLSLRRRGMVLSDLAAIAVAAKEIDQACAYGQAVVELARQGSSGVVRTKLHNLAQCLSPYSSVLAVSRLNEQIQFLGQ